MKLFFKFSFSVLMICILIISISSIISLNATAANDYVLGDVNGDNIVNKEDAVQLLRHILFPERYSINQPADFNGDGKEDSSDAVLLFNYVKNPSEYILKNPAGYTVTWKNENGTVLETDNSVPYGTTPTYNGSTPTKPATAHYTYAFKGWSPVISDVTEDVVYIAQYDSIINKYTVTWKNADGTVLETDKDIPYGTIPTYDGAAPTKPATAQYTYTFSGWSPAVSSVSGDVTYTAKYSSVVNEYSITWQNYDGTVLQSTSVAYGNKPTYNGRTPKKPATAQYTYTFKGWSPVVSSVTCDAIYTAQFYYTVNEYTVTWKNYDGSVLLKTDSIEYGTTPTYIGTTPTKPSTAQYTYTFKDWSPSISTVTEDVTYIAQFDSTVNKYTVTWKNADGTVLETDEDVPYGTMPTYDGAAPTKPATAQYTYTFSGWSPVVSSTTKNITYTAQYDLTTNNYSVTWINYNGDILEADEAVPYGTSPTYNGATPTKPATAQYTYTFIGWSPSVSSVTKDVIYTAQYKSTVNNYKITWKNDDGTIIRVDAAVPYGTIPEYNGAIPTKPATAQYTYVFTGWSPSISEVTRDAVYIAEYRSTVNKYTVTWVDYNGTVLETDADVLYGATPSFDSNYPTRSATAQYTYTFVGWSPIVSSVTKDVTYTAQYDSTVNKYTITWKNYDGAVLETDATVPYGEAPSYNGETPTKPATAQYTYTFSGWTPALSSVTGNVTYTAQYDSTVNKYTVMWKNYNGDILQQIQVEYGKNAVYSGLTPTRENEENNSFTFREWNKSTDNITEDTTVFAQYDIFDVYLFVYYDGSSVTINVPQGEDAGEYYPTNSAAISSENADTSFFWEKDEDYKYVEKPQYRYFYQVTYVLNGGTNSELNPVKVYSDTTYTLYDANAGQLYYTFGGWYKEDSFDTPVTALENVSENITLYAKYVPQVFTITYHLFDGTNHIKNPGSYTIEDVITLKDPSKTGYTFKGWYSNSQMTTQISTISHKSGDIDLYAKFEPNKYTVSYDSNLGIFDKYPTLSFDLNYTSSNGSSIIGKKVTLYNDSKIDIYEYEPVRTGYTFVAWYYDAACTRIVDSDFSIQSNTTIYAGWSTLTNIINIEELQIYRGDQIIKKINGVKTESTGSYISIHAIVPYKYKISINRVNVAWAADYKSGSVNISTSDGTWIVKSRREQYYSGSNSYSYYYIDYNTSINSYIGNSEDSVGWKYYYYNLPATELSIYLSGASAAVHFSKYPSYNKVYCTASSILKNDINYDEVVNAPKVSRTGYTFLGWYNGNDRLSETWKYTSNVNFTAKWEPTVYGINYVLDGGQNSVSNPSGYTIESNIQLYDASKEGYTFNGWYTDANFKNNITSISGGTGDLTLYAKFTINSYSLTLDANGGAFYPKIEFVSDGEIIRTEYLSESDKILSYYPEPKEGKLFAGWYSNQALTQSFNFTGAITNNIVLYAKWIDYTGLKTVIESPDSFDLNINGNSEKLIAFVPITSGKITVRSSGDLDLVGVLYDANKNTLCAADDISDTDLNFEYTYNIQAGKQYYIAVKGQTSGVVGEATVSISYSGQSYITGTTYTSRTITQNYNTTYTLPDLAFRDGYTFVGWFDSSNNQITSWDFSKDITVYAIWEKND